MEYVGKGDSIVIDWKLSESFIALFYVFSSSTIFFHSYIFFRLLIHCSRFLKILVTQFIQLHSFNNTPQQG